METAGFETDMEKFLTPQECSALKIEKDGTTQYRFEQISFVNTENPYAVSKEKNWHHIWIQIMMKVSLIWQSVQYLK